MEFSQELKVYMYIYAINHVLSNGHYDLRLSQGLKVKKISFFELT